MIHSKRAYRWYYSLTSWFSHLFLGLICLSCLVWLIMIAIGPYGLKQRQQLLTELQRLQQQNRLLQQKLEQQQKRLVAIQQNPLLQESVIRDTLGWVHPGDTILLYQTDSNVQSKP